jgi:hypothetical protein
MMLLWYCVMCVTDEQLKVVSSVEEKVMLYEGFLAELTCGDQIMLQEIKSEWFKTFRTLQ